MAKIVQQNIVITVSKLDRDDADEDSAPVLVPGAVMAELETLVTALVGDGLIVELKS